MNFEINQGVELGELQILTFNNLLHIKNIIFQVFG